MDEFRLAEASLQMGDFSVAFKRRTTRDSDRVDEADPADLSNLPAAPAAQDPPAGLPILCPMTGIFYGSPSPSSPPFVREGEQVSAGQVIGLIEAMKVFNEIPCPVSGSVLKLMAASGQLVEAGDVLMVIG